MENPKDPKEQKELVEEPNKDTVDLSDFVLHIYNNDEGGLILDTLDLVGTALKLHSMERRMLYDLKLRHEYSNVLVRMFELWITKEEASNVTVTLQTVSEKFNGLKIASVEANLKIKFKRLDLKILIPKEPEVVAPNDPVKPEGETAETGAKEPDDKSKDKDPKKKKAFFSFKKGSAKGGTALAGSAIKNPHEPNKEEADTPEPIEIKYLSEDDAEKLESLVAHIHNLKTSLQVKQFLCKSVYHIAACVPMEDNWIPKVALISMEMFSIIRHFIEPGMAIRKDKWEGVVRRFIVDPGLAPQLIDALEASGMLVPKQGEKRCVLLIEPCVKEAIDVIQNEDSPMIRMLESPYPNYLKIQEKLLVAVVAAVEEYKDAAEAKSCGKKLTHHISYLVKEIVWPLKHPGFRNVQAKIPKVIRFCTESVIAITKQRYESLPNVSVEDMKIFKKAYEKAQEEKNNLAAAIAAGAAIGMGTAALTLGAAAAIDD